MAQYSGMNAVLDSSLRDLRTMKSNRLVVFSPSLLWASAVKVVPYHVNMFLFIYKSLSHLIFAIFSEAIEKAKDSVIEFLKGQ